MVQDEDIKTGDESTSAKIESIMSEIDTADTQLKTPCSIKEPKTHHCSDPNATAEPSITPFEDRERRSIHANVHTGRTSAIVGSASAIAARSLTTKQHQAPGGPAEAEEQEWEITGILEKRAAGSETVYRVRWKDTWLPRSELGNAQGLLEKFEAKGRAQHGRKRGRPAWTNKGQ